MNEKQDYIERLFAHDVDRIPILASTKYQYDRLLLSSILRRLVIDGLVHHANRSFNMPLLVLVPEPQSGNIPIEEFPHIPDNVQKYAPSLDSNYPPGFYNRPYWLDSFRKRSMGVLLSRSISADEAIKLVANKLGGVHLDNKFDSEALYELNKSVSFFGEGAVYQIFDKVSEHIWRCFAPLRDSIVEKHGGSYAFPKSAPR